MNFRSLGLMMWLKMSDACDRGGRDYDTSMKNLDSDSEVPVTLLTS